MFKKIVFSLLLISHALFASKLPDLSPKDVAMTLKQMMEAHASHKTITPDLIKRAVERYLDEMDPNKTYLLKADVESWLHLDDSTILAIQKKVEKDDFSPFQKIHSLMATAIKRRHRLDKLNDALELPKGVSVKEFKDLDWAKTEEELQERLLRIKALQLHAMMRLDEGSKDKAYQRMEKRRFTKEEDFTCENLADREKAVLTLVLKAFACAFDTHTAYFTPAEAAQFMIQVQQRLFGIGAQLRDDLNGFCVVKLVEGGPATHSGLRPNDRIIAINGEPVVGLDILDAVELIRGEEGTRVMLTVLRGELGNEQKCEVEVTRGEVVIKEARIESHLFPFGDGVIAQISLHAFYQDPLHSSSTDLYEEIHRISKEHSLKGVILDLRSNSGGVLPQAVAVTGLFITKGIVVSIKDNNGNIEHLREIDARTAFDGPLIVLTSKASASAAEIVAQTLQDYGRAIVVGDEHTFGKGTFQTFTLDASNSGKINPKGEFKVTRGRYYTVSGKSPQLVGVRPDIIVPGFYSALEIGEKHAKYPLENDAITENYYDDLSDIPVSQRDEISWLYRFNLQQKLKSYTRLLPTLKKNSEERLKKNLLYQEFLKDLKNEEVLENRVDMYVLGDLQLNESIQIMKDVILLMK